MRNKIIYGYQFSIDNKNAIVFLCVWSMMMLLYKEILKLNRRITFMGSLVLNFFVLAEKLIVGKSSKLIDDGKTGILVSSDDPDVVENAIRKALTDDNLVNNAAEKNWLISVERLNANSLKRKTIEFYKQVIGQ